MEKNCGPEGSAFLHLLYREFTCLHCSSHPKEVRRISPISINQSLFFFFFLSLLMFPFPSVSIPSLSWDISSIFYIISPITPQGNGFIHLLEMKTSGSYVTIHLGQKNWSIRFKKHINREFHANCHRNIQNWTDKRKLPTVLLLSQGPMGPSAPRTLNYVQNVPENYDGYI